jgi:aspartate racemase
MHVGLIGGIGPAATEVYYRALVRAYAAANRRLALTIVNADLREMAANLEAGRAAEQAAIFAGYVDQLRAGGCEIAALTSMGGHFCIQELEAISTLPLLNAIPALDSYFSTLGVACIGVLGTRRVMESRLYGLASVEVVTPPKEDFATIHSAYVALAAAGLATPDDRTLFHAAAAELHTKRGAEVVVLGGTDLSVAFTDTDLGFPIVDSALVHADAIARATMAS